MSQTPVSLEVDRHKAALKRTELSRPVRLAIAGGIITKNTSIFDYGCGVGGDVERLQAEGYNCEGWDPYYFPDNPLVAADIVNLGYIINVIEDPKERKDALKKAWKITQQVLIVSAQILVNEVRGVLAYGDGILTKRNTFQKYYTQSELKDYIQSVLKVEPMPIGLGIFFVFKDEIQAENFRASQLYAFVTTPSVRIYSKKFEEYQELLQPLIDFISQRGRIPVKGELPEEAEINNEFGYLKRAFKVILTATDEAEWDAIAYQRSLDLQVYLALAQFGQQRSVRKLPPTIKADIKAFFGSYEEACEVADRMLFKIGEPGYIKTICQKSKLGKLLPNALYVHTSTLNEIDPHLRLYEGCASRNIGGTQEANIIKFHTDKPCISYLSYPDFDTDPHPRLDWAMLIDLRDLSVTFRDYQHQQNAPILHRKETFVSLHYPLYEQFARLTAAEEAAGLLTHTQDIGYQQGWLRRLQEKGVEIVDHHLVTINS
jgi:DNA phosphorothioation-associated putative methyltransferase